MPTATFPLPMSQTVKLMINNRLCTNILSCYFTMSLIGATMHADTTYGHPSRIYGGAVCWICRVIVYNTCIISTLIVWICLSWRWMQPHQGGNRVMAPHTTCLNLCCGPQFHSLKMILMTMKITFTVLQSSKLNCLRTKMTHRIHASQHQAAVQGHIAHVVGIHKGACAKSSDRAAQVSMTRCSETGHELRL